MSKQPKQSQPKQQPKKSEVVKALAALAAIVVMAVVFSALVSAVIETKEEAFPGVAPGKYFAVTASQNREAIVVPLDEGGTYEVTDGGFRRVHRGILWDTREDLVRSGE